MDTFKIPDDATTLWGGPPERMFPYAEVDGKIALRVSWHGADPCDIETTTHAFDSIEAASDFLDGLDAAPVVKWAVEHHVIPPTDRELWSRYFETVDIDTQPPAPEGDRLFE